MLSSSLYLSNKSREHAHPMRCPPTQHWLAPSLARWRSLGISNEFSIVSRESRPTDRPTDRRRLYFFVSDLAWPTNDDRPRRIERVPRVRQKSPVCQLIPNIYRGPGKGVHVLLSSRQAEPGRNFSQLSGLCTVGYTSFLFACPQITPVAGIMSESLTQR